MPRLVRSSPRTAVVIVGLAALAAGVILACYPAAIACGLAAGAAAFVRVPRRRPRPRTATGEIVIRDLAGPDEPRA